MFGSKATATPAPPLPYKQLPGIMMKIAYRMRVSGLADVDAKLHSLSVIIENSATELRSNENLPWLSLLFGGAVRRVVTTYPTLYRYQNAGLVGPTLIANITILGGGVERGVDTENERARFGVLAEKFGWSRNFSLVEVGDGFLVRDGVLHRLVRRSLADLEVTMPEDAKPEVVEVTLVEALYLASQPIQVPVVEVSSDSSAVGAPTDLSYSGIASVYTTVTMKQVDVYTCIPAGTVLKVTMRSPFFEELGGKSDESTTKTPVS